MLSLGVVIQRRMRVTRICFCLRDIVIVKPLHLEKTTSSVMYHSNFVSLKNTSKIQITKI